MCISESFGRHPLDTILNFPIFCAESESNTYFKQFCFIVQKLSWVYPSTLLSLGGLGPQAWPEEPYVKEQDTVDTSSAAWWWVWQEDDMPAHNGIHFTLGTSVSNNSYGCGKGSVRRSTEKQICEKLKQAPK